VGQLVRRRGSDPRLPPRSRRSVPSLLSYLGQAKRIRVGVLGAVVRCQRYSSTSTSITTTRTTVKLEPTACGCWLEFAVSLALAGIENAIRVAREDATRRIVEAAHALPVLEFGELANRVTSTLH
jgi:hypothetical protein